MDGRRGGQGSQEVPRPLPDHVRGREGAQARVGVQLRATRASEHFGVSSERDHGAALGRLAVPAGGRRAGLLLLPGPGAVLAGLLVGRGGEAILGWRGVHLPHILRTLGLYPGAHSAPVRATARVTKPGSNCKLSFQMGNGGVVIGEACSSGIISVEWRF